MHGRVLIIAGSDSGGGAGIQADIKTVSMLDAYAATAITALTAQNTEGVFGVLPIPPEFVRRQIEVVLDDIGADAIKTGMLHDLPVIETIAAALGEHAVGIPVVIDPVMVAKGGARLIDPAALDGLKQLLIGRAEIDGVVEPQPLNAVLRHHHAQIDVALAAPVKFVPLEAKAVGARRRLHRGNPFRHHLAPDAVAGDYRDPIILCHADHPLCHRAILKS